MKSNRRDFIKKSAKVLGAAGAISLLPASIRRALAIPASSKTGTINDVEHVVVLMQENRSFDHYLGHHAGFRGFNDRSTLPVDAQASIFNQPDGQGGYVTTFHLDSNATRAQTISSLPHGWSDGHAAWNDGRWDNWVPAKGGLTMGHFARNDIPFHYALADAFTVCDAYFASCLGPTNTNRLHLMTGMIDVAGTGGGPLIDNTPAHVFTWTTYPERLQKAGVSWRVYQGSDGSEPFRTSLTPNPAGSTNLDYPNPYNVLNFFQAYTAADADPALVANATTKRTLAELTNDVKAGTLPQVSWLLPPYLCSEHPARSPADGATYIAAVLDALTSNPDTWSKTALFITYDENDGFFDHVVPPSPPMSSREGLSNVATANEFYAGSSTNPSGPVGLGARVPMFVVSPWSKGAWTCSEVFDHTSIIKFIEKRFGVVEPNISAWRRAICGDLTSAFDFTSPDASAVSVPSVAGLSAAAAAQSTLAPPTVPATQVPSQQERGSRNARALPYELFVDAAQDLSASTITLSFINTGSVAAGFAVYSAGTPTSVKRYTVDANSKLSDSWRFAGGAAVASAYDLTVIAPNGFVRRFVSSGTSASSQEATVCYEVTAGDLAVNLVNTGKAGVTFRITDNRYGVAAQSVSVAAGQTVQVPWSLAASKRWYDLGITCDADARFLRQFAGHVEIGAPGVTDPSMA
ncbi:phosphocholine-specific phospholipase C [Burkholderia glumae]|uniref:phosphocholine-specific phospholipase C n=1 Tax=Burkholderia glumae TaxID=337 RepID=UPI0003A4CF27|nr:phospholipase C, phosphocholine-specific [Burkholderia glumae]MCM2495823.1 phospholipase C, phosphocholine-specific [Burkholderia glumae]